MKDNDETAEQHQIASVIDSLTAALTKTTNAVSTMVTQPGNSNSSRAVQGVTEALTTSFTGNLPRVSSGTTAIEDSIQNFSSPLGFLATLNPIVAGLAKLFGGGSANELPALLKYERPDSLRLNTGMAEADGWTARGVDYAANGLPRSTVSMAGQTQIVVQVQAMDSKSFLDHRDDIASAVRQALLESHSLNDVMSER